MSNTFMFLGPSNAGVAAYLAANTLTAVNTSGAITSTQTPGVVLKSDPAADAADGGFKFQFVYNSFDFANGPGGEVNYVDDVWSFGINVTETTLQLDATKAAIFDTWEARYYSSGAFGSERHIQSIDTSGVAHRPFSMFLKADGTAGSNGLAMTFDYVNFFDWAGTEVFAVTASSKALSLFNGAFIEQEVNNTSTIMAKKAAGGYVNILKLDASDITNINTPMIFSGATPASGIFMYATVSSIPFADSVLFAIDGPSFANIMRGISIVASPTSGLYNVLGNTGTSGSSHAKDQMRVSGASGGDPYTEYLINGVLSWSVGADNSDSDAFVVSKSTGLGTSNALRIDTNLNVAIGSAALATGATDGFLYIPTCAGAPSGTPTAITGRVPIIYDTTNNKLYVYNGAWKGGTAPGAWS